MRIAPLGDNRPAIFGDLPTVRVVDRGRSAIDQGGLIFCLALCRAIDLHLLQNGRPRFAFCEANELDFVGH